MKNNVWYHMTLLDGISECILQLNNTTIINDNGRALWFASCSFIIYFDKILEFYYSAQFVFFSIFQLK